MKRSVILLVLFSSSIAQAASYYCASSSGNGYINTGYTMAQVQAVCGNPTSNTQQQSPTTVNQQLQSWLYTQRMVSPINDKSYNYNNQNQGNALQINLVNNQVTSIVSSERGNVQSWSCPQGNLRIGMSANEALSACGQPTTVNNSTKQVNVPSYTINTWVYQQNSYSKPLTLEFQNGILSQAK